MLPITKALIISMVIMFLGVLDLGCLWLAVDYGSGFIVKHYFWFWFAYTYGALCVCAGIFMIYDLLTHADEYGDIWY